MNNKKNRSIKIWQIYEKFVIPPNLQQHMLKVAVVTEYLKIHWIGVKINWDDIIKMALLHDLGNIVKFDFDKYSFFIDNEYKNIEFWKNKQKESTKKYGSDDHKATKQMLEEIGFSNNLIEIILDKSFENSIKTANSDNWTTKILFYCDLRVLTDGVGTLDQRFEDIKKRLLKYSERLDFPDLINACKDIEKQIQKNINIKINQITEESISKNNLHLLQIEI